MKNFLTIVKTSLLLNSILVLVLNLIPREKIPNEILTIISIESVISILFWLSFVVLWRIKTINFLIGIIFDINPSLQGTWYGLLNSNYDGAENREVYLIISQPDAFTITCKLITENRMSSSKTASIIDDCGSKKLIYTYFAEQDKINNSKNPMQYGTAIIDIGIKLLGGTYFSNQKTNGNLQFSKICKKRLNSYKECKTMKEKKQNSLRIRNVKQMLKKKNI